MLRPRPAVMYMPGRRQFLRDGIGQRDALPAHRRQRKNSPNTHKPLPHLILPSDGLLPKRMKLLSPARLIAHFRMALRKKKAEPQQWSLSLA